MAHKESSGIKTVNFCRQSHLFTLFINLWIRTHKVADFGTSLDPDPQHCFYHIFVKKNCPEFSLIIGTVSLFYTFIK